MATSDPVEVLIEHDRWASRQMVQACAKLSPEQFARSFEMGPGSLQATVTHIIGAMRVWNDILAERPVRPRIEQDGIAYSPARLLPMLEETAAEFGALARKFPVDQTVLRVRDGKEYRFMRGAIIAHVTTHGMHHRAQCLNMLRQMGVSPLPLSSVVEWLRSVDSPQ